MSIGIDHVSLTVTDRERSVEFYTTAFGFEVERIFESNSVLTKHITEFPRADLKVGLVRMDSLTVELIEYREPRGAASQTLVLNDVGSSHLAFVTDDIQRDYERLRAMGVPFKTDPGYNPETGVHAVYGYDPDGITFELVQRD